MERFQIACALGLAVVGPLFLVIVRHHVRFTRLRALYEFDQLFSLSDRTRSSVGSEEPAAETSPPDPAGQEGATPPPIPEVDPAATVQSGVAAPPPKVAAARRTAPDDERSPTFEYVRARYTDDLEFPPNFPSAWVRYFNMGAPEFRAYVRGLRWWRIRSSWSILWASLPLTCMIAYGLTVLFTSGSEPGLHTNLTPFPAPALLIRSAAGDQAALLARNATVVAESAFVGAYMFTLLLLLRALATFDLSPLTIMRATIYFGVGITSAVLMHAAVPDFPNQAIQFVSDIGQTAYRALPGADKAPVQHEEPNSSGGPTHASENSTNQRCLLQPLGGSSCLFKIVDGPGPGEAAIPKGADGSKGAAGNKPAESTSTIDSPERPVSRIWIALAFLLGFVPDLAINQLITSLQGVLRIKQTDQNLLNANKSIPLELIDGIDALTRFRLQEANVFEMQNLAVVNPVMLFIETPFGIYQVMDWVAQAQLCVSVGPERFIELQKRSIRTIFDLERAVLSEYTTSQLRRYVASILLAPPSMRADSKVSVLSFLGLGAHASDAAQSPRDPVAFATYTAELFSQPGTASDGKRPSPDPDETIKHFVRTIVDDLHVCRLRQVWQQIMTKIDGQFYVDKRSDKLWDTQFPPDLPEGMTHPIQPSATNV